MKENATHSTEENWLISLKFHIILEELSIASKTSIFLQRIILLKVHQHFHFTIK